MIVNNPWPSENICDCEDASSLPKEGTVSLQAGTDTYVVSIGTYPTSLYGFEELYIENTVDGASANTGLVPTVIAQSATGFTLKLNGNPTTSNGKIKWKIRPRL